MQLGQVKLREINNRFYLCRVNKRDQPTQKLDITDQVLEVIYKEIEKPKFGNKIIEIIMKYFSNHIIKDKNNERHFIAVKKLDREQNVYCDMLDKKTTQDALRKYNSLLGTVGREYLKIHKDMYRFTRR